MRLTWKLALFATAGIATLAVISRADAPSVPMLEVTYCEYSFMNLDSTRDSSSSMDLVDAKIHTLQMCRSRQEWLETAATHPLALDGAEPLVFLQTICDEAEDPAAHSIGREAAEPSNT